ncbi:protease inhibitor I9 family protein [Pararhodonellum marinum]|uniref:protease inhibitor I9 family protein n=1 Tax=Pararhodonellum marinum TaxID=2755358 RepID=UPI0018900079|nr:protease inhibitor I9 family protein [Pararhodonellum marinum]
MGKIASGLKKTIDKDKKQVQKVIILTKETSDLSIPKSKKVMENTFSATLSGEEILKLAEKEEVVSIENDEEMVGF